MTGATLKDVAKVAGVAPVTVSRVVNESEKVATRTREKVLSVIRDLDYLPNVHATRLRRGRRSGESRSSIEDAKPGKQGSSARDARDSLEGRLRFSSETYCVLAREIMQLRKDVERLRRYADRIQACVELIEQDYCR